MSKDKKTKLKTLGAVIVVSITCTLIMSAPTEVMIGIIKIILVISLFIALAKVDFK